MDSQYMIRGNNTLKRLATSGVTTANLAGNVIDNSLNGSKALGNLLLQSKNSPIL